MAPAPLGEFEVLVLLAVLHLEEGGYAPAVRDTIEKRTGRAVSRGSIYVTLDRLETKRYLHSRLDESTGDRPGRPRRYYRIAPRGLRAVRRALQAVERMRDGLVLVLDDA